MNDEGVGRMSVQISSTSLWGGMGWGMVRSVKVGGWGGRGAGGTTWGAPRPSWGMPTQATGANAGDANTLDAKAGAAGLHACRKRRATGAGVMGGRWAVYIKGEGGRVSWCMTKCESPTSQVSRTTLPVLWSASKGRHRGRQLRGMRTCSMPQVP